MKNQIKFIVYKIKPILNSVFNVLLPNVGSKYYTLMQKKSYKKYTQNIEDAKNLCVGHFEKHENYPYEKYLLENYDGDFNLALDFGCGVGRMMNRMLKVFDVVHGIDISENNLIHAKKYLLENGVSENRFHLFLSNGNGCITDMAFKYDFIYSTIVIQHIAVHSIRIKIFNDIYKQLSDKGIACLQFGFGWDNGTYWKDNYYAATSTNGGHDFSVPDESHLEHIILDMKKIGFKDVSFQFHESPHPEITEYHPVWIFMTLKK